MKGGERASEREEVKEMKRKKEAKAKIKNEKKQREKAMCGSGWLDLASSIFALLLHFSFHLFILNFRSLEPFMFHSVGIDSGHPFFNGTVTFAFIGLFQTFKRLICLGISYPQR